MLKWSKVFINQISPPQKNGPDITELLHDIKPKLSIHLCRVGSQNEAHMKLNEVNIKL